MLTKRWSEMTVEPHIVPLMIEKPLGGFINFPAKCILS